MSKAQLRLLYRAKRSAIDLNQRLQAAQAAADILTRQTLFRESEHIACYLAYKDEFDTLPLIAAIWKAKKKCYLPVLSEPDEKTLLFMRYKQGDKLHLNRYSIQEPMDVSHKIPTEKLDLVITPLIAFDLHGNRLGTGGGYYDRTFAFLNKRTAKPHLIGLGFAIQQVETLPFDDWDIQLNSVLTEKEFINLSIT